MFNDYASQAEPIFLQSNLHVWLKGQFQAGYLMACLLHQGSKQNECENQYSWIY